VFLFCLCAGEDLPLSSGDVDEGCQWEIQADEGWVTTGTHRSRSTEEAHSLLGRRECAYRERHRFHKNSDISVEASFKLRLL
jgi:hypothetical protein